MKQLSQSIVCLLLLAPAAAAQVPETDTPQSGRPFMDRIDVNVVNVEVFVTDRDGRRVTDLRREDFELREDGREVQLTNFLVMEDGVAITPGRAVAPDPEAAEAPVDPLLEPAPTAQRSDSDSLHLVIYIDNFNLRPANRARVLRDVRTFLTRHVRADDQVMLVSYSRTLKINQPFTSNPVLINNALFELEDDLAGATQREADRRRYIDRIEETEESPSRAVGIARQWAEEVTNELRFTIDALKELVRSISGLPGRKAILYVSDGLPMMPGLEMFHAVQTKYPQSAAMTEQFGYNQQGNYRDLTVLANSSRISFYTIDAEGLRVSDSASAEHRDPLPFGVDGIHTNNVQGPIRYVAEATGGLALINRNRYVDLLDNVAEDLRTYYSLGYHSPTASRGGYHNIEVRVKRKGLTVRHREGYRHRSLETRMIDATLAALHFGFEQNPLGIELDLGPVTPEQSGYAVPVEVAIPMEHLVFTPRGDIQRATARLYVAVIDEARRTSPVQQVEVPIQVPTAELTHARTQPYVYTVPLLMRAGEHRIAVGVRDEIGGADSIVTRRVKIGPRNG